MLTFYAALQGKHYSDIIRGMIDDLLDFGPIAGVKYPATQRIKIILRELREPFIFIRTPGRRAWAKRERSKRELIARRLESIFNI